MAGVWGLERVLSLRPQPGSDQCVAVIGRTQEGGGCRVWTSSSDDVEGPRDPPPHGGPLTRRPTTSRRRVRASPRPP